MSEFKLVDLLKQASQLKRKRSQLKEEMSSLTKEEDSLLTQARNMIDESGLESVKFTSGDGSSMIAYRTTTVRASMGDPDEFQAWCESRDNIDPEMFTIFSPQKLTSFVRECTENEEAIPEGVRIAEFDEVRIRRG